jgi:hypothetical protein
MESGSAIGTYVAYVLVCLFLVFLTVVVARSVAMMLSLVVLPFMGEWWKRAPESSADAGAVADGVPGTAPETE